MKTNTYEMMRREREKSIIDISQELFFSQGVANTTMKDIAAKSQISRQTLYSYYKDIDELIIAVQSRVITKITQDTNIESDKYSETKPLDYINYYLNLILNLVYEYPDEIIFISQFDLHFKLHPRKEILFERFDSLLNNLDNRELIINKIIQGQEEGSIRSDKSSTEIYITIINIALSLVQRITLVDSRIDMNNNITEKVISNNVIEMVMLYIKS